MPNNLIRVAVTGGAGQLAYSLLFRIASGEMFGFNQPIALHILEIPEAFKALEGVKMELDDCSYPLLKEIHIGSDPFEVFKGVHYALLVGAKPRGPGVERQDLLKDNGKIFSEQGRALNQSADKNVKILVVGNPCNTNCLIAMENAPQIPRKNFFALTRLDQNRATAMLAQKAQVDTTDVTRMTIWGNHSSTQVPDFYNATIKGSPVTSKISDLNWLENGFVSKVQQRGAEIISYRGKSSSGSAANAIIDAIKSLITPTSKGEWFSSGVCSDGNPYGIEEGIVFSFPCRSNGKGDYEIVKDLHWNEFLTTKIKASQKELIEERNMVMDLLTTSNK